MLKFEIHHTNQKARRGTLHTAHGSVQTPAFMPVGSPALFHSVICRSRNNFGKYLPFNAETNSRTGGIFWWVA